VSDRIVAERIVSERLVFLPVTAQLQQALLGGDLSAITPGPGWPHIDTHFGLEMSARSGGPAWPVERDGAIIGECGTTSPSGDGRIEVTYGLAEPVQGEGYGVEIVAALRDWLLRRPGITSVSGDADETTAEPAGSMTDPRELLAGYLDFYRDAILRKLDGMTDDELRTSRVPSGWTPLGLVNHLAGVERRWFQWGFAGIQIEHPWGTGGPGADWVPPADRTTDDVVGAYRDACARSRAIAAAAELGDEAAPGGRFGAAGPRPSLIWTLFHVLQEYARHAGHLDIVRELVDGVVGE